MADIVPSDNVLQIAERLALDFAETAVERDVQGGVPKIQRDQIRESSLLKLTIPGKYGGLQANWPTALQIVRRFAQSDSSIAHVFGFHHLLLATVTLFGSEDQQRQLFTATVKNNWFWGNALNPLDKRTIAVRHGDQWLINGVKSYCSGAGDSDILIVSALTDLDKKLIIGAIPSGRQGIAINIDWDNMGQRQTDSGTVCFNDLWIANDELLTTPGPLGSTFASLRPCLAQLILVNVYLGIGEGAFAAAKNYTLQHSKPWVTSGVDRAAADPYTLRTFGQLWIALEGARLLADRAVQLFQDSWDQGDNLTTQQRGETALAISAAKVTATNVGLEVVNRIFEVMGAGATTRAAGFDRYWRNIRTHSLHDPVDYKLNELGNWALNDKIPLPSFYS